MKLLIIGMIASGKTTLAQNLSARYNIPAFEGDCIAWGEPGQRRHKRSKIEQEITIETIVKNNPEWIIEGAYRRHQHILLDLADVIVFLDPPLALRKTRILTRFVKQKLHLETSNYTPRLRVLRGMYRWTKGFENHRDSFEQMLSDYQEKLLRADSEQEALRKISRWKQKEEARQS